MHSNPISVGALLLLGTRALAQESSGSASCTATLSTNYSAPSVAAGYTARLVANNLTSPRGIKFDTEGNLLVIEEGVGITALNYDNDGNSSCALLTSKSTIIADESLNHGIELSADGSTLYASNSDKLYSWTYSPSQRQTTSNASTLVQGMEGTDHTSRTLLLSRSAPGMILVNRGSFENIDVQARSLESGHSQVKASNISGVSSPLDFNGNGVLLGWGLRNDVGIAEHPGTGGIWSVENSADQVIRSGEDIHEDNPAEKLNFLGYLNGTESPNQGQNFGYPDCFAAWVPDDLPGFEGETGEQFALNELNATNNDEGCADRVAPRLVFQAHMAPLDIKFNSEGTQAWISFHGSWNRDDPTGNKLSVVDFAGGEPVESSNSMSAATDIVSNPDNSECPSSCFRPVGLAWDEDGRLFMSSDSTGEIYMISREEGATGSIANGTTNGTTGTNGTSSATPTSVVESTSGSSATFALWDDSTFVWSPANFGALAILLSAWVFLL